ncbi:MAG: ATPase [Microgenomates group bacterium Gr01-1014_16]|nr:MAG: ATPase [Microgenomates group bacterium Gr01-1014_16]
MLDRVEKEMGTDEAVVLTGMRQVGKTTILKYLYEKIDSANKLVLDMENPLHRKIFEEENYDNVWKNLEPFGIKKDPKTYLFLDEIQNLPGLPKVVKYLYDHYKTKFFLTGSSSYYLKNLFSESMAGRKLVFEIFPLDFKEFLVFKGKVMTEGKSRVKYELWKKYYDEYLEFGGFPKVVLESDRRRKLELLEEIFKSYFEIDVKNLADFSDITKVRDLILLLVSRVGAKMDISKLASELGTSRETIYNYLAFLEQTYFIFLVPKFSKSIDRQAAGEKKLYLCDTGLASFLGRLSDGQRLENAVFNCLRSRAEKINYYDKSGGFEIDFVLDGNTAVEVKKHPSGRDMANLKKRAGALGLTRNYVASYDFVDDERVVLAMDI